MYYDVNTFVPYEILICISLAIKTSFIQSISLIYISNKSKKEQRNINMLFLFKFDLYNKIRTSFCTDSIQTFKTFSTITITFSGLYLLFIVQRNYHTI